MLISLVVGEQRLHFLQVSSKLDLEENKRVAGRSGLHLCSVGSFAGHVVNDTLKAIPFPELLDAGSLVLDGLPHPAVIGLFGRIAQDFDLKTVWILLIEHIALTLDSTVTLLKIAWAPRGVDVV
ncbi:hypothetical protein ALP27_200228 [Pseudomonas savastanoi pv. glycinea]|nr:hypothetical protein ALP27_200228 [Pseudomonas savastanoi pv. glycinea]